MDRNMPDGNASVDLDSEEARESARRIEAYRRQVIEERWLSTLVLSIHLEIESMLSEMLRQTLPKPERFLDRPGSGPTFSQKLTLCESLDLLDDNRVAAVRALNRLRNTLAHNMAQTSPVAELVRFLAAMSGLHAFTYRRSPDSEEIKLQTYQQMLAHFESVERSQVEYFLFISLKLLRANLSVMFKDEPPSGEEKEANSE